MLCLLTENTLALTASESFILLSSHSGPGVECWVGDEIQDCTADGDSAFVNSSKDRFDDTGDRGGIIGWFVEAGVEVGTVVWFDEAGVEVGTIGWFDEAGAEAGVESGAVGWFDEAGAEVGAIGWFDEAGAEVGAIGWFDEAGVEVGAVGWFDEAEARGGTTGWETQMMEPGGLGVLAPEDTVTCTNTRSSELVGFMTHFFTIIKHLS